MSAPPVTITLLPTQAAKSPRLPSVSYPAIVKVSAFGSASGVLKIGIRSLKEFITMRTTGVIAMSV